MCNIEEDKVLQFETVAVDYISDLDAIACGILTSSTQKLNRLISELRAGLQQKKESLLRFEGSNAVTKKINEDLFCSSNASMNYIGKFLVTLMTLNHHCNKWNMCRHDPFHDAQTCFVASN